MKKVFTILLSAVIMLAATGCGSSNSSNSSANEDNSSAVSEIIEDSDVSEIEDSSEAPSNGADDSSVEASVSGKSESSAAVQQFKTGLWKSVDGQDVTGYYYFSDNMQECSYHSAETGTGLPFDYEITDSGYVFHMGSIDDNTLVTAEFKDDETVTLKINESSENLIYIGNISYDDYSAK